MTTARLERLDRTSRDVVLNVSSWSRLELVALTSRSRSRLETITPMSRSRLGLGIIRLVYNPACRRLCCRHMGLQNKPTVTPKLDIIIMHMHNYVKDYGMSD